MSEGNTVRWHVTTTKETKRRIEALMHAWFPGRERMQGPTLDRIVQSAYDEWSAYLDEQETMQEAVRAALKEPGIKREVRLQLKAQGEEDTNGNQ